MPILIHNNHGISSSARPITNWLDNIISDGLYREKRKKCVIIGTLRRLTADTLLSICARGSIADDWPRLHYATQGRKGGSTLLLLLLLLLVLWDGCNVIYTFY